jgi:gliding motility-associated-like protein
MKRIKYVIFLLIVFLKGNFLFAQPTYNNCVNALEICPNTNTSINNLGSNKTFCTDCEDDFSYCFTANNTIWLKFTTNSSGGDVQIDFSNLVFQTNPGQDNELQATLISTSSPCTSNSYTQLGNCVSNATTNFSLNAIGLTANTTYYIIVNGDNSGVGITQAAECTFNLTISGTGVNKIPPSLQVNASSLNICKDQKVTLVASLKNCPDSTLFSWYINGELVTQTQDTIYETTNLNMGDTVTVSNSCYTICTIPLTSNNAIFNVHTLEVDAGKDASISLGQTIQLNGTTNAPGFEWSPDFAVTSNSILNPIATPTETTTYTFHAYDSVMQCDAFDDVTIFVKQELLIPTTFSPNNDGINDTWEILGIENYPNSFLQIFDRWGQEVFQKTGYSLAKAWRGDVKGGDLSSGVYFYSLELRDNDKQIKKGSVTVVR